MGLVMKPSKPASASQASPGSTRRAVIATIGMADVRGSAPMPGRPRCRRGRAGAGPSARRPAGAPLPARSPRRGRRLERAEAGRSRARRGPASGSRALSSTIRTSGDSVSSRAYSPPMPIRLVLAEDHYLVREGVRGACSRREPGMEVAAACGDLDSLLEAVERERPGRRRHRHPDAAGQFGRGHPGRRRLRETNPKVGVVVLSQYADAGLRAGAARHRQRRARLPAEGTRRTSSSSWSAPSEPSPRVARSSTPRSSRGWWRKRAAPRRRRSAS